MELTAIYRCVAALDVHQSKLTVCILYENESGEIITELKEFGGFKRDRRAMADWVASFQPELVVMESTGIYWKSPNAALEKQGLTIWVVNARHVKQVPGRNKGANHVWLFRKEIIMHIYKPLSAFVQSGFLQEQLQNKSIMKQTLLCVVTISLMCSLAYAAPEDRGSYTWSKYTVKIPARDSGSITALLYIPTAQKTYPLLAIRHGLSKKKIKYLSLTKYGEHFASRGFVVLLPNARTESYSDFEIEADDINDCIKWAVNRSKQTGNSLSGKINETRQAVRRCFSRRVSGDNRYCQE